MCMSPNLVTEELVCGIVTFVCETLNGVPFNNNNKLNKFEIRNYLMIIS